MNLKEGEECARANRMPITALPPDTVRSIGATQILTDSCSVVKELIDNSLDACAEAIFVEVSVNSLDVIQVKDNGPGIHPDDRAMLGKPHCTSKIKTFADLSDIGGKSLGFRGEALANAAAICGSMIVSTRVYPEHTGVRLTINRQGRIEKEERISLAVGTIVRAVDFLKNIPVRREAAIKASAKSLKKIKRLLQSYTFARPSVRFSLKVLKAKNDHGNWEYVPTRQSTALDAAVKIVGKRVVDQCQWKVWNSCVDEKPSESELEINEVVSGASYKFEAIVPTPCCDSSIVSNAGQYLSIDSRPISGSRGSSKHLTSTYKSYLRSGSSVESFHDCKDPFLYLHIICPSSSYDANVEPAKDDVLFADTDFVIARLECFLKSIYGELKTPTAACRPRANPKSGSFDLLLARKPRPTESPLWTAECRDRKIPCNNHGVGEQVEDDRDNHAVDSNSVDEEGDLRDVKISNPWTFAKINASVRHGDTPQKIESQRPNDQLLTPARQAGEPTDDKRQRTHEQRQFQVPKSGLRSPARTQADHLTPSRTQPPPAHNPFCFPQKAWREKKDEDAPTKENTPQRGDDAADISNSWLPVSKSRNNFLNPSAPAFFNHEIVREDETRRPETRGGDFVSARTLPLLAPLNGIPELQDDRIRGLIPPQQVGMNLKKGSFSPEQGLPNIRHVWNDASACARSEDDSVTDSGLVYSISSGNPGLVASKDGERRRQGTLQTIELLKPMIEPRTANALQENLHPSHTIPSPYKNCQAASPNPNPKAASEPGDPRAYPPDPFQQQHNNSNNETLNPSSAHHRPGQNRSEMQLLPLEARREELATRNLTLVIPTTKLDINGLLAGLRSITGTSEEERLLLDEYIASGEFFGGFPFHSENYGELSMQTHQYEPKIRALLASVFGDEAGAKLERINFSSDLSTVR